MVWGAVIGAVGSLIGGKQASDAAGDAAKYQAEVDKERLAFEKEQYAEWQETYGDIEDNLAKYYEQLTPALRTVQNLEAYEKEKGIAVTNLRENLAQRGIATSGIAAQTETSIATESAAERARIRADAPMETAREQASFLQVGLGQDPSGGISSALSDRSTNAANVARDTASAAGAATQSAIKAGTNLASELYNVYKSKGED